MFGQKYDSIIRRMFIASVKKDKIFRASVISCIAYKKITVFGENKNKTSTVQHKYSKDSSRVHIHAEIDVITKAKQFLDKDELAKATLIVIRHKLSDDDVTYIYGNTTPCSTCRAAINDANIVKVIYHDGTNFVFEE